MSGTLQERQLQIERVLSKFSTCIMSMRKRLSGTEAGCVRVQSSRYQSYTWKEGVEGGMGNKEASWEKIGGAQQYISPV